MPVLKKRGTIQFLILKKWARVGWTELFNEDADARARFSYSIYCKIVTWTEGSQNLGPEVEIESKNGLELIQGGGFGMTESVVVRGVFGLFVFEREV